MSLLGVDVGLTGCKALVIRSDGKELGHAYEEYQLIVTQEGWIELDPQVVWRTTVDVIRKVSESSGKEPIKALSFSTFGICVAAFDKDLKPLTNFMLPFDTRGDSKKEWWMKNFDKERVFKITGLPLHSYYYTMNKVMWIREEIPEIFKRTWKFLLCHEYLIARLGLEPTTDYVHASSMFGFDIRKKEWSEELFRLIKINPEMFARFAPAGTIIGELNGETSGILNLPKGTIVVNGTHDQPACALGAGVVKEGHGVCITGTVECILVPLSKPLLTSQLLSRNYACHIYPVQDTYFTYGCNFTAGRLLKWYRDNFYTDEPQCVKEDNKDVYSKIVDEVAPKRPSMVMVLPYFMGAGYPIMDPDAKGAILGLTLGTTKADLVKGILEGITYALAANIKALDDAGVKFNEMVNTGGGSNSPTWVQLKADITGKRVRTMEKKDTGCIGAAILAGLAVGEFKSLAEGTQALNRTKEIFEPDENLHDYYQERFEVYQRLYGFLKQVNFGYPDRIATNSRISDKVRVL